MDLVVFGIDGTLVGRTRLEDEAFVEALRAVFELVVVDCDWSGYRRVTDSGILDELFRRRFRRPPTPGEVRRCTRVYTQLLTRYLAAAPREARAIPGAVQLVRRLQAGDTWRCALASGDWTGVARLKLERAGLMELPLPIATADDALSRETIVRQAIARAEIAYGERRFRRVVCVGDSSWDRETARALHLPFLGVGPLWTQTSHPSLLDYADGDRVLTLLARAR